MGKIRTVNVKPDSGNESVYSTAIMNVIETSLEYIRRHPETRLESLDRQDKVSHYGDFYRLLAKKFRLPKELWWITLRLNGMHSTNDFIGDLNVVYIPSMQTISSILERSLSTQSIT